MLAIRLQRVGRSGYPVYRIAVQESQRHPSSGRVISYAGTYNPHTKEVSVQKEIIEKYLGYGAQPSPIVVKLLKAEGVKLPSWVKVHDASGQKTIKHADKLRKNRPAEEVVAVVEEAPVEVETPAEKAVAEEAPAEETVVEETPAEEAKTE